MPKVVEEKCPKDHACPAVQICPESAITQDGYAAPVIDQNKCTQCGACIRFCPYRAFQKD